MRPEQILAILYEMAIVIGGEIKLQPLLTKTLSRLLFHTSFPCGMVLLDAPELASRQLNRDRAAVRLEVSIGDFELAAHNGKALDIPVTLLRGGVELAEDRALINALPCRKDFYSVFLRLPIGECGVVLLLSPVVPAADVPYTTMFQPVMGNLAKAILLCRSNEAYTRRLIEDQKRAETALQDLSYRNRLILESVGEGICGLDRNGNATFVNPAAARMLGFSPGELIDRPLHEVVHHQWPDGTTIPHEQCAIMKTIRDGTPHRVSEDLFRRRDGTAFPVEYVCTPLHDGSEAVGAVIVFQDISERKEAEEEIRQLASIVESSDDAIIGKTLDGTIVSWNRGAERLYGYTAREMKGKPVSALIAAGAPDDVGGILHNISRGDHVEHYETVRRRKDGALINVSLSVSPVRDRAGRIIGASTIARDITQRKRAEEKLEQANAYNRSLIEASLDPLVTIGPDGTITDVNDATEKATGRSRAELVGTDFSDYFTDPERARSGYQQVFREGMVRDYELEIRHKDGFVTPVLYNASLYRDKAGNLIGIFAAARDITERKKAEEKLKQANAYNRSLIEASLDPLVTIGPDGRITDVNDATEKATGRNRGELIGTDFSDYFTEPDRARSGYQQVFREGMVRDYELEIRHRDGGVTPVLYNASLYRDKEGKITGIFAAARDITERKRMEASLHEQRRFAESIIANSAVATFVLDPLHRVVLWNKACEELTGVRAGDMIGTSNHWKPFYAEERPTLADLLIDGATERVSQLYSSWGRSPLTEQGLQSEGSYANLNGRDRFLFFEAVPIYTSSGELSVVIETFHDITERKRQENDLRKLNRALFTLSSSNMTLIHARDELTLMQDICKALVETGGYSMAWVGYVEADEKRTLRPVAHAGREEGYLNALPLVCDDTCDCPASMAIRSNEPLIAQAIVDLPGNAAWRNEALARGYASCLALPLRIDHRVVGALSLYAAERNAFTDEEMRLLTELAGDVSFGITTLRTRIERDRALEERQSYLEKIRRVLEDTVQAIAAMLEMRDPYIAGHQRRVAELAVSISKDLGLQQQRIEGIHFGSLIHDIGKIYVPAEFLSRPGKLHDLELSLIKTHPQVGYDIIKDIEFPWPVASMIRQHHEHMDGSGYPQGLKGGDILLEARILVVADVVEAMASHRPYRPARGIETALAEIVENRGIFYDGDVVDACIRLFREKGFAFS